MNEFIKRISIFSLPLLVFLIGVNFFGDAAKIFHSDYEKEIVRILKSGANVTNIANYDERVFQKEFIQSLDHSPNVVVLGSSRTLLIDSELFNETSLINSSVSGASIEDLIAIYQLYKSNNVLPKEIILGLDPWTFNENSGQINWKSISNEFEEFAQEGGSQLAFMGNLDKYVQLFSLSYFQASLPEVGKKIKGSDLPQASDQEINEFNTKFLDGAISYGKAYRDATEEEINEKVDDYLSGSIYGIEDFFEISPRVQNLLVSLVTEMKSEGIKVSLFLAPYHPKVFSGLKDDYPNVLAAEEVIGTLAKELGLEYYGSFDPAKDGLTEKEFYDGMHCTREGIIKSLRLE